MKIFKDILELEGWDIIDKLKFEEHLKEMFEKFNKKYRLKKINVVNEKTVELFLIKKEIKSILTLKQGGKRNEYK